jgi:hypothetical protein
LAALARRRLPTLALERTSVAASDQVAAARVARVHPQQQAPEETMVLVAVAAVLPVPRTQQAVLASRA